jgi:adenylate cyclase
MNGKIAELARWVLDETSRQLAAPQLLAGLAERMIAAGVPIWRVSTGLLTMHPEIFSRYLAWVRGKGCELIHRPHEFMQTAAYIGSPVEAIHKGGGAMRSRLDGLRENIRYDVLKDLKDKGATDYLIQPLPWVGSRRSFIAWSTDAEAGFSDEHLAILEALVPALSVRLELECAYYATEALFGVYLGPNAAKHVLEGEFKRGTGQSIQAAIWFCDMRGFTKASDQLAPPDWRLPRSSGCSTAISSASPARSKSGRARF